MTSTELAIRKVLEYLSIECATLRTVKETLYGWQRTDRLFEEYCSLKFVYVCMLVIANDIMSYTFLATNYMHRNQATLQLAQR